MTRMTALVLAAVTLSACAPTPTPSPTPTAAFASEEEAFAAAEEVYRAYLSEAAARAEGEASADPEKYLSGEALDADLQSQRSLQEQSLKIVGASVIDEFIPLKAEVTADICIDISGSRVLDENGTDVTVADRPESGQVSVEFSGDSERLLISRSSPSERAEC